ncbi:MAG: 13E12 repeat family protein, partial [Actinobacteria bacterium]|nr:13E12 repeat family protein [Actinomycetota bacterium]
MEAATTLLRNAIDALVAVDPHQLADGESVVELHRELARLDAVTTRATGAFDAGREWESSGGRSAAAWIGVECNLASATAGRKVQLARGLRHMPEVETAWLAGQINDAHVAALDKARRRVEKAFASDEEQLVGHAKELVFSHFRRVLAYWLQQVDPDGDERDADKQHDSRHLNLSQSFEGMWFLDGVLDPISGEIVSKALRKIEDELFAIDWAEAKARVSGNISVADLSRTAGQRRADALVEMARRAMAMPEGSRLPEPLFSVFVDYETFAGRICQLASGTVISPGS